MFHTKHRKQEQQWRQQQRQFELELARAMAEEGLTGERRRKTLETITGTEKRHSDAVALSAEESKRPWWKVR